jgi:uncharacterized protein (DUF885 family)
MIETVRFITALCALILFAATARAEKPTADQAFADIWQSEWQWRLREMPLLASSVGEHRYDDQLDDVSVAANNKRADYWRAVQTKLKALDTAKMSVDSRVNLQIYQAQLQNLIDDVALQRYLISINSDSSFYSAIASLPRMQQLNDAQDYERYLARLAKLANYFEQHTALLKLGAKRGMTPPRVSLQGRLSALDSEAKLSDSSKSAFYRPFVVMPERIPAEQQSALQGRARVLIASEITPAFAKLQRFLQNDYLPKLRTSLGAERMPNGKAFYQAQIREFVTEDISADDIHAIGLAEMARIRAEMEAVLRELKFDGDIPKFLEFLRTDPQFYPRSAKELLAQASYIAKRADAALPRFFTRLPRQPYGVQAVPSDIAPFYTAGRYVEAPENSTEPGWYWVNTHNLPARALYSLPALTLHEAVPGHHLQISLAREQAEQPPFRRFTYISAFGEGWALYSEALGVEMGIYETPYERFGQLSYAAWRASRLVVDTGLHAKGWTREQAIAYMQANTALSIHEVTTEVDRYLSWPGQALSYMMGAIRIRELRARAEKELGGDFDVREFHDQVLAQGSVPLSVLSAQIEAWIAGKRLAK